MRPIITIVSMFCCFAAISQNRYNTLKVEGCIKKDQSTDCLAAGAVLSGSESFKFDKPGSFAVLVGESGEFITIKPADTSGYTSGRELRFSFPESASTDKTTAEGTAKRGISNQQVTNFNDFFGTVRFTVIGDEMRFGVSSRLYPISKDKFLVLNYKLDTSKVSKRLGFRDQVVRIQKSRINEINGNIYDQSKIEGVNLYYYEPATKSTERVATFDLVFVGIDQLYSDFDAVLKTLPDNKKKDPKELSAALESFFNSFYGKTEPQSLKFAIDEYVTKLFNK